MSSELVRTLVLRDTDGSAYLPFDPQPVLSWSWGVVPAPMLPVAPGHGTSGHNNVRP